VLTRNERNYLLALDGVTKIEPCASLIYHLEKWTTERKTAGLSTVINPQIVAYDGTEFCFKETTGEASDWLEDKMPDDHANDDDDLADSTQRKSKPVQVEYLKELKEQLAESQVKHNQLRPRSYKTWMKCLKSDETFKWRSF
jgi:hypothetical protein